MSLLHDSASWDGFKVTQFSADHYLMAKRTRAGCSWIKSGEGQRARRCICRWARRRTGSCDAQFLAKASFGHGGARPHRGRGALIAWFWSPEAPAMDIRHYDTLTHVESSYEGAEELRATPYGVGNTSELTIWCRTFTPSPVELEAYASYNGSPPRLYASRLICGARALLAFELAGPGNARQSPPRREAGRDHRLYQREVEQRRWYGFWDYGDFMHSYDPARHVWNYDLGGCAWQNTELVPNMWLWLMFCARDVKIFSGWRRR